MSDDKFTNIQGNQWGQTPENQWDVTKRKPAKIRSRTSQIANSPVIRGALKNLIARFGVEVNLYHKTITEYDETYGIYSGVDDVLDTTDPIVIKLLLPINPYAVTDDVFMSSFNSVFVHCLDQEINNGDIIEMFREDDSTLRFKIVELQTFGLEQKIITKFKITPLGE